MLIDLPGRDHEVETAYLIQRIEILIQCFGELLPGLALEELHPQAVLDIACGPGIRTQKLARRFTYAQVFGLDTRCHWFSQRYQASPVRNMRFRFLPGLTGPFPFEDSSFDLVTAQCARPLLPGEQWSDLLAECYRVLRPGGILHVTETEPGFSNAPALEELHTHYISVLQRNDQGLLLSDRHIGWLCDLEPSVYLAGFEIIQCLPHILNYSYGAPYYESWKRDVLFWLGRSLSRIVEHEILSVEQARLLHQRVRREIHCPHFRAVQYFLTVCGRKH